MKRYFVLTLLLATCFAQQQEILRPTADFDPGGLSIGCTGSNTASFAMPKAWDSAGLTTASTVFASGTDLKQQFAVRTFKPFGSTGNVYSALTLNVNASFFTLSLGNGCIKYSIDSGVTYTTIKCSIAAAQATYSITLDPLLDLSKLRVSACAMGGKGNVRQQVDPGEGQVTIWDIWTAGTNPVQGAGNGSTAGQAHRGAVVTN